MKDEVLFTAIYLGNYEIVKAYLAQDGADPNKVIEGCTLLYYACDFAH